VATAVIVARVAIATVVRARTVARVVIVMTASARAVPRASKLPVKEHPNNEW
jgi:hypothetical protein